MKAIVVVDGDRSLSWREVPTPEPGPGEVRIRVRAAGVNRADVLQRQGLYPPPPGASDILGLECAGEVDAVGPGVTSPKVGDPVCALLAGGGYAEHVVCPAVQTLPIPAGLSAIEAAALPEAFATAWLNLYMEAGARPGERILVHAGASGVGTAAIQLARERGNPVFVTVGRDDKLARCLELGASGGCNRKTTRWPDEVARWTEGAGFDVILDPVAGDWLADDLAALATGGRVVVIGLMGGRKATIDAGRLLVKRLKIVGSTLRSRSVSEKAAVVAGLLAEVWPAIGAGRVRPVVHGVLPVTKSDEALSLLAADDTVGKLILAVP